VGHEDEFPQTAERPLSAQSEDFVGRRGTTAEGSR